MRLYVDTQKVTFTVTKNPEANNDQNGQQRHRKDDGAPKLAYRRSPFTTPAVPAQPCWSTLTYTLGSS